MARRAPAPPIVIAGRATLGLVAAGAIGIATYGRFVVSRAPAHAPVIDDDLRVAEALAAAIVADCTSDRSSTLLQQSPLATSGRTVWAEIDCGFERELGSGIAARAVHFPEVGDRSGVHATWTGDLGSMHCAASPTQTCTGVLVDRNDPTLTEIVRVRRFSSGDGWSRVEAIVRSR
jgi:hypothetical protein